jgi:lactate permease
MSLFFATAPLLLLVYLMTRRKALPAHVALPIAAVVAYVVRLGWFGNDPTLVHAAVLNGLLTAWTPILIVWGAILLFRTMERSGAMAVVRAWLRHISDHPVAQLMIVGWAFAFLIEGASGFGTPAALAAPLLVGMGFAPVRVAILTLVMNSVPVTFGAVGTPIWFGLGELGPPPLSAADLLAVSWRAALLQSATALVVPVLALGFVVPWRVIRQNLGFVYLSVFSCVLPMLALSFVSHEFAALGGGLVGLLATVALARAGVGLRAMPGRRRRRRKACWRACRGRIPARLAGD